MNEFPLPPAWVLDRLRDGLVIPAHPLATHAPPKTGHAPSARTDALLPRGGSGGLAVGVHTTQFAIREPKHGLLRPCLN
jgi:hypothetical protein